MGESALERKIIILFENGTQKKRPLDFCFEFFMERYIYILVSQRESFHSGSEQKQCSIKISEPSAKN